MAMFLLGSVALVLTGAASMYFDLKMMVKDLWYSSRRPMEYPLLEIDRFDPHSIMCLYSTNCTRYTSYPSQPSGHSVTPPTGGDILVFSSNNEHICELD